MPYAFKFTTEEIFNKCMDEVQSASSDFKTSDEARQIFDILNDPIYLHYAMVLNQKEIPAIIAYLGPLTEFFYDSAVLAKVKEYLNRSPEREHYKTVIGRMLSIVFENKGYKNSFPNIEVKEYTIEKGAYFKE